MATLKIRLLTARLIDSALGIFCDTHRVADAWSARASVVSQRPCGAPDLDTDKGLLGKVLTDLASRRVSTDGSAIPMTSVPHSIRIE
jgi:hypothetical protein